MLSAELIYETFSGQTFLIKIIWNQQVLEKYNLARQRTLAGNQKVVQVFNCKSWPVEIERRILLI